MARTAAVAVAALAGAAAPAANRGLNGNTRRNLSQCCEDERGHGLKGMALLRSCFGRCLHSRHLEIAASM